MSTGDTTKECSEGGLFGSVRLGLLALRHRRSQLRARPLKPLLADGGQSLPALPQLDRLLKGEPAGLQPPQREPRPPRRPQTGLEAQGVRPGGTTRRTPSVSSSRACSYDGVCSPSPTPPP